MRTDKKTIAKVCEAYATGQRIKYIATMHDMSETGVMKLLMKYYLQNTVSKNTIEIKLPSKINYL